MNEGFKAIFRTKNGMNLVYNTINDILVHNVSNNILINVSNNTYNVRYLNQHCIHSSPVYRTVQEKFVHWVCSEQQNID
jgi:hypothetical protein